MTDNRTTELLRELLDELGVEYTTNDHMGAYETSWNGFTATQLSPNANLIMAVTPEQAIAATLGSPNATGDQESIVRSFLREISPNRDWDYLGEHEHALIANLVNVIAATLGSGALAIEQIKDAVLKNFHYDRLKPPLFDWQAIADELNETLGSGTCEIETRESWLPAERYHRCKHCGAFFAVMNASGDIPPCVCPNCGKAVKR